MAKILGIQIKNFGVLKDVTLGKLWNQQKAADLSPMTVVIGRNGTGKTTLFDAFGFLFERIRSQGQDGPIEFVVYYLQDTKARPPASCYSRSSSTR